MPERDIRLLIPAGILGGQALVLLLGTPFVTGRLRLAAIALAAAGLSFASYFAFRYRRGDQGGPSRRPSPLDILGPYPFLYGAALSLTCVGLAIAALLLATDTSQVTLALTGVILWISLTAWFGWLYRRAKERQGR